MEGNEEYTPAAMLVNFKGGGGSVPKGESGKEGKRTVHSADLMRSNPTL